MRTELLSLFLSVFVLYCFLRPGNNQDVAEGRRLRLTRSESSDCQQHDRQTTFELPHSIITKTLYAAEISAMTYSTRLFQTPEKGDFDFMEQFFDLDDVALVARRDGVCYAAFRGTVATNLLDIYQIFDDKPKSVNGCLVRRGYHRAYFALYYNRFMAKVEDCMNTGGTELVVTGHSQGGSNAMIAFLDLQRFNPTAITFGAMRALVEPCDTVDSSKIYRYTNVGYNLYDGWSNCLEIKGVHMGHSIMLDANSTSPAVYLGLDEDINRSPITRDVHSGWIYWDALEAMLEKAKLERDLDACTSRSPDAPLTVKLRGWEDGHWCSRPDECQTGSTCVEGECVAIEGN
ncbi:expressed unknown protein [Seminavis robusta]|uniref:Fungal lipase-type domain-containing protein n=1 Tax=Seminavis robusta TaxID=568900 RepID=A0A9N8EN59_9STRA|nr:expressed unknown protein [Seminavis robusta]|eukprot:Sro1410_g270270.1 n/a (346) ;mRNA; r:6824-7861